MHTDAAREGEDGTIAFALGGLAGNNAYGAGFLQAALDHGVRPDLISCSSGQIVWVYRYLLARRAGSESLEDMLAEDIAAAEPFQQPNADLIHLALHGKPGTFRLASYEIALDAYKNMLRAFVDMAHNWDRHMQRWQEVAWMSLLHDSRSLRRGPVHRAR